MGYPVLATCPIRPLNQTFESTFPFLSRLADSPKEEYNRHAFFCLSSQGVTDTVYEILAFITRLTRMSFQALHHRLIDWTKPATTSLLVGTLTDLGRRQVRTDGRKRAPPAATHHSPPARETTLLYQNGSAALGAPGKSRSDLETRAGDCSARDALRWHRQGFKLYWKYKSRAGSPQPTISTETVALIKDMARDNRLWGAERIRGELLKLGIHVCKRTIQKYMRQVRTTRPHGQTWATFLRTHAEQMWACDFLPVTDLLIC